MQNCKRISHAAQLLLHLANNTARTQILYIITSARNAAAIAKGMVELRSIVFDSREVRARWRQGTRRLKLRMVGGLGGLMMTPRRSSGCGACIPELTTRRHRGPLLCLGSRAKASTLGREAYTFHRRFRFPYVFSWAPLLVGDTAEVVSSSATSRTELIPHNYRQYWCTQQTACTTHAHPYCN